MVEWLKGLTLDPRSRSLRFDSSCVMCKSLGQALNSHFLCPSGSNGYQVERKLVLCDWLELQKITPKEMILWKSEFQYQLVNNVKSAEIYMSEL